MTIKGWIDNILNVPGEGGYNGSAVVISRVSGGTFANSKNVPVTAPKNDALVEDNFNTDNYSGARFGLSYLINNNWELLVQHTQQSLDTEGVFAYDPNLEGESSTNRFVPENNNDDFGLTTWTLEGRLEHLDIVYTGGYLDRDINSTIDYTGYTNGGSFAAYYACSYAGTPESQECIDLTKFYKEQTSTSRITHELHFATGKAFEDSQEYNQAFQAYQQGNKLQHDHHGFDINKIEQQVAEQIKYCTRVLFENRGHLGLNLADPIFIVGLPHAGSTLLEQILASHSQIDGTMELHNILGLAARLRGRSPNQGHKKNQYPKNLSEISPDYFKRFGQQFIDETRDYREQAPLFIDKMPNNLCI